MSASNVHALKPAPSAIAPFPFPAAVRNLASGYRTIANDDRTLPPTWSMMEIARRLGVTGRDGARPRSAQYIKRYIAALIVSEGFPPPLPVLVGTTCTREIQPYRSRWVAGLVEAWFGTIAPPALVAELEQAAARDAANRLDARADALFEDARA